MNNDRNIKRYLDLISSNISRIDATLDYDRVTTAIINMANLIIDSDTTEETWWLESPYMSLDDLIVGAFWHYTEWHKGQWSQEYLALSALGRIYTPSECGPDDGNQTYDLLELLCA